MNKQMIFIAALAMAAPGAPAVAQEAGQADAAAEDDGLTSTNTIVCRRLPAPTGSRVGARRVCKTEAEWGRINREARGVVEEAFNRSKYHVSN